MIRLRGRADTKSVQLFFDILGKYSLLNMLKCSVRMCIVVYREDGVRPQAPECAETHSFSLRASCHLKSPLAIRKIHLGQ